MASSIAVITTDLSIDFSRATASAICNSSSLLALTAPSAMLLSPVCRSSGLRFARPRTAITHRSARGPAEPRSLDQPVDHHELRLCDIGERNANEEPLAAAFGTIDAETDLASLIAFDIAAEAFAAGLRHTRFNLRLVPGPAL